MSLWKASGYGAARGSGAAPPPPPHPPQPNPPLPQPNPSLPTASAPVAPSEGRTPSPTPTKGVWNCGGGGSLGRLGVREVAAPMPTGCRPLCLGPCPFPSQVVYQIPKKPYAGGEDPELRLHVVFYFARLTPPGYVETEVGWCAWWW